MTARAFACFVKDRMSYQSDYLAGHADRAITLVAKKDEEDGISLLSRLFG